ncbi:unnamed protein product [Lepeophtheirus salmonis]|uniref:(salmon louse) hypothetical protein n=1 Tax=Lepeophtheirus salmonis TaxID=72036 RepID=A0A817FA74_LEPSM|nr:unnamed protein product [Lepeophtheirus salmonis]CAG9476356.1 unnamed protein product [Lepeophtheirus salmonis]
MVRSRVIGELGDKDPDGKEQGDRERELGMSWCVDSSNRLVVSSVGVVNIRGISSGLADYGSMMNTMRSVDGGVDRSSMSMLDGLMTGLVSRGKSQKSGNNNENLIKK